MKSCKADLEMLGDRRQVNAQGLLREVHVAEEGVEAGVVAQAKALGVSGAPGSFGEWPS